MALTGPTKESKVTTAAPQKPKGRAGRPKSPQLPNTTKHLSRLADRISEAEEARENAAKDYALAKSVAHETALLQADLAVSSAWAAYLRATGDHVRALKYLENATRIAGRISALRELQAVDTLEALKGRAEAVDQARRAGGH